MKRQPGTAAPGDGARPAQGNDAGGGRLARLRRPTLLQVGLASMALALAWFLLGWAYPLRPVILNWLPLPLTPALGALATVRIARLPTLTRAAARLWRSLACSTGLVALGNISLTYDSLSGPAAPREYYSPLTLGLYLSGIVAVLWAALRLPVRARSRHEWIRVGLDIGTVLVASGLVLAYIVLRNPVVQQAKWSVLLPLATLGILVAIRVSLTGATGIDRGAMHILAFTVLISSLLGCANPLLADRHDLHIAMLVMPITYAGLLLALEMQRRVRRTSTRPARRRLPFSLLPYAAIACSDALLLTASRGATSITSMLVVGSVALTALVIVRQMMAFVDNHRYQRLLAHRASHDELTGLANRRLFRERAEQAVATGAPGTVAIALVDLDDFKSINDRLGHSVGDALIAAVSDRLGACVRPQDTVARLGGDEFAVLLTGLKPECSSAFADRVLGALIAPVTADGHDLLIQASIGLADNSAETGATVTGAGDLLRCADIAMYAAKELGGNRYVHYDADMEARTVEHAQLAAELTWAIDRDELELLYQPIVDLASEQVVGAEALIRWKHPHHGSVSPARFIPVAEQTGLIVPIGAWVLRTACAQAADWQRRLGDRAPERITVNVSARQLLDLDFAETVATVLAETGLEPARLTVEITETAVFGGGRASETVAAISALGVGIALDDFGTGHSSLGLLRTCPVNVLKVDKSFVDGVTGTVGDAAITTAVIEIAQAMGLRAIAEGVETPAQAKRLYELGYRLAQGFHFARPMPAADVEALLPVPALITAS